MMNNVTQVSVNPDGTITLRTADALNSSVHRDTIAPGAWDADGNFMPADLSDMPPAVSTICGLMWTADVIATWKRINPYVPPAPPEEPAAVEEPPKT